eukprot:jgi/Chlat1/478/Chrsp103S00977
MAAAAAAGTSVALAGAAWTAKSVKPQHAATVIKAASASNNSSHNEHGGADLASRVKALLEQMTAQKTKAGSKKRSGQRPGSAQGDRGALVDRSELVTVLKGVLRDAVFDREDLTPREIELMALVNTASQQADENLLELAKRNSELHASKEQVAQLQSELEAKAEAEPAPSESAELINELWAKVQKLQAEVEAVPQTGAQEDLHAQQIRSLEVQLARSLSEADTVALREELRTPLVEAQWRAAELAAEVAALVQQRDEANVRADTAIGQARALESAAGLSMSPEEIDAWRQDALAPLNEAQAEVAELRAQLASERRQLDDASRRAEVALAQVRAMEGSQGRAVSEEELQMWRQEFGPVNEAQAEIAALQAQVLAEKATNEALKSQLDKQPQTSQVDGSALLMEARRRAAALHNQRVQQREAQAQDSSSQTDLAASQAPAPSTARLVDPRIEQLTAQVRALEAQLAKAVMPNDVLAAGLEAAVDAQAELARKLSTNPTAVH